MIPALLIRMSSLSARLRNSVAAFFTEAKEDRSSCRKEILASGTADCISLMAASAFEGVRAARKILSGLCLANCMTVSLPRPALPVMHQR